MSDQAPTFSYTPTSHGPEDIITQGTVVPKPLPSLPDKPSTTRLFLCQVMRTDETGCVGAWRNVTISQAKGRFGLKKAGQYTIDVIDDGSPQAVLYEGEKIRIYRGIQGAPLVRVFTGYIDQKAGTKTAKDGRKVRTYTVTDYRKDLKDAITLRGQVFDGFDYGVVLSKLIIGAMDTNQLVWSDDNATVAVTDMLAPGSGSSYNASEVFITPPIWGQYIYDPPVASSTPVAYFPELLNDDGTPFLLPCGSSAWIPQTYDSTLFGLPLLPIVPASSGTLPSTGAQQNGWFQVPAPLASGTNPKYLTFELPKQYMIASTFSIGGTWKVANAKDAQGFWTSSYSVPPPAGSVSIDWYNGVMYFNPADVNKDVFLSFAYWEQPLFDVPIGQSVGDAIDEITSKIGMEFLVNPAGKFYTVNKDILRPPQRVYTESTLVKELGVAVDRDRRNVLMCLGFDPTGLEILGAKVVNVDDWVNPPPLGLGKRAYMILQDKTWKTQDIVDRAAYYAALQAFRRGRITTFSTQGDPYLGLENAVMFRTGMQEISPDDIYFISTIDTSDVISKGVVESIDTVSCQSVIGRGMFSVFPTLGGISSGIFDYRQEQQVVIVESSGLPGSKLCLTVADVGPAGGTLTSEFSIAANNLGLRYGFLATSGGIGLHPPTGPPSWDSFAVGTPQVYLLVMGSDGYIGFQNWNGVYDGNLYTRAISTTGMTAGAVYLIKATFFDTTLGARVYYRDFIFAGP